jgi:ABC-type bacteriocin/lantibiotic exporter with double-glycine peptidase domain
MKKFNYNLNNFYYLLPIDYKKKIFFYILILFSLLFLNIFSFSLLVPFFSILIDEKIIDTISILIFLKKNEIVRFNTNNELIFFLGFLSLILILISNYLLYINEKTKFKLISAIAINLTQKFISSVLNLKYSKFIQYDKSIIYSKLLIELEGVVIQIFYNSFELISRLFIVFIIFIGLLIFEPVITLSVTFAITFLSLFVYKNYKDRFKKFGKNMVLNNKNRTLFINEIISNFISIKINNLTSFFKEKFLDSTSNYYNNLSGSEIAKKIPKAIIESSFFCIVILVSIFLFNSNFSSPQNLTINLSAFAIASYKIMPSVQLIFFSLSTLRIAKPKFDSLVDELKIIDSNKKNITKKNYKINFKSDFVIEGKNITIKFNNKTLIKSLNFRIKKNSITCISGISGSGKTSLLHSIIGLIKPNSGNIKVYGIDAYYLSDFYAEQLFSFTPQISNLFFFNLKKNIYLEKKFDNHKLKKSLEFSGFNKYNLLNFNTNKRNLSGGEIKKILLSRNIYNNREIIILDEPTVYLDEKSIKNIIQNIINLKNKTIIFTTHNPNLKKIADHIIEL